MAKKCEICKLIKKPKNVKFETDDLICFRPSDETIVTTKDHCSVFDTKQEKEIKRQIKKLWPGKEMIASDGQDHVIGVIK